FVIRAAQERVVFEDGNEEDAVRLREALDKAEEHLEVEIPLTRRAKGKTPYQRETFGPRDGRTATVRFSARSVNIRRPRRLTRNELPETIPINIVRVHEPNPPEGEKPVEWILLTTEPVGTREQVVAV